MRGTGLKESLALRSERLKKGIEDQPESQLRAWLVGLLLDIELKLPPLAEPDPSWEATRRNRGLSELLARACLTWKDTGQWSLNFPPARFEEEVTALNERTSSEDKNALLVIAALQKNREAVERVRRRLLGMPPDLLMQEQQGEVWFLTQREVTELLAEHPDVRWGWIDRICADLSLTMDVAPTVALAIRYCEEAGLDFGNWLRSGMNEIDADFLTSDDDIRIEAADFELAALRKPKSGLGVKYEVTGKGGRIQACLPVVLEQPIFRLPLRLIHLLNGELPSKQVAGVRSKRDVRELISKEGSVVSLKIELSGQLSIEDRELDVYRLRFESWMERVRGCFPEVKAKTEIVVVK